MKAKLLSLTLLPFLLISCGDNSRNAADDKISAQNNFEYFQTAGQKILYSIQQAKNELSSGDKASAEVNLDNAEKHVQFLLSYQLPLMEVRKLVHDSWRLYTDGRIAEIDRLFTKADQFLEEIKGHGQPSQVSAIKDIQAMLIDVQSTIKKTRYAVSNKYQLQDPSSVASKFYLLTGKMNEIILSSENTFSSGSRE